MALLEFRHEDDLLTIIDRVLQAPDDELVLDFPEGSRLFASEENLSLLKREAEAGGKNISLRTLDARGHFLASQAGIALLREIPPRAIESGLSGPGPARLPGQGSGRRFSDILPPRPHGTEERRVRSEEGKAKSEKRRAPAGPGMSEESEAKSEEQYAHLGELLPIPEVSAARLKAAVRMPKFPHIRFPWAGKAPSGRAGKRLLDIAIVAAGIAVVFLVLNEVLPGVSVTVHPRTDPVVFALSVEVAVDAGEEGTIPGQRIEVEERQERNVPASGTAEVTDRARGTITVVNAYSSVPQTLVATTRFVSQDGKLFRLDETTVVPGAKVEDGDITPASVEARVTADQSGPEYNIGPSSFSIPGFQGTPKFTAFTAKSNTSMAGGARGTVKVVTENDVAAAREGLQEGLGERLQQKFAQQAPRDLVVLEGATVETMTVTTDVGADARADQVVGRAEGRKSAIVFSQDDLDMRISTALEERISEMTEAVPDSIKTAPSVAERDIPGGRLLLTVEVEAQAAWHVDTA
ncbi:MAG: hypothetical protein HY475_01950, partial [Candidatus Terrybacteria bacterium]|nr:hypothetical protein [Candidatus Terrybacteria bacterium]